MFARVSICCLFFVCLMSGCSVSEEMRRIELVKQARLQIQAGRSTNLTGEQVFLRSCNTCHPQGKEGLGPRLDKLAEHFPSADALKKFIRYGKGIMPKQPQQALSEAELDNLVNYLKHLDLR